MGSSGGIPEIGVRLTAQGVNDVVLALQRVRQEAKTTGVDSSASIELVNGALDTLKQSLTELLPVITFAAAVESVSRLAEGALETADALGKLSEKTGAAIGTLSVLNLVAHDSDVDQESFSKGLLQLAKNMENASEGAKKPATAFRALGITVADLKNQDPGELFVTVAQKLDALPPGAQKAQIAMTLLGKAGADLIPMLDSLGVDGFDKALDKAKKLGIYLDGDMVEAAKAAHDSFLELEDIATGLGTRFIAGFAPGFTQGIELVTESFEGQGVDSVRKFGEFAADVFKGIIGAIELVGQTFKVVFEDAFAIAKYNLGGIKATLQGLASGGVQGAIAGGAGYISDQGPAMQAALKQNSDKYFASITSFQAQLEAPPKRTLSKNKKGGGAGGNDQANQDKTDAARSAYEQSLADNELALLKTTNSLAEAEDKRHYDAGLITVDDYYSKVEDRIKAEAAAETDILQTKLAAANDLPDTTDAQIYKKLQTINDIQTQIDKVELKSKADVAAAEDSLAKAKHDNALKELDDKEKLQKADGDVYGAEQTQLQIELQQYDELLKKRKDLTDEERASMVDSANVKGQAKIGFSQNSQQLGIDMAGMNQDIQAVQDQASSGAITQIAAETKILDIETKRLATMKLLAQVMLDQAIASGDKGLEAQARASLANLDHLGATLTNVTSAQTYLINQLSTEGVSALTNFFTAGIDGSKSFADALGDLGAQFEQIVAGMISKLIVYETLAAVIGWIDPSFTAVNASGNSGFTAAFGKSPFGSGHADGGWTGDVPTNQIAGYVHGQEYVVKAGPAAANRALLDAMNSGAMNTPTIAPISAMQQGHADYAKSVSESGGVTGVGGADSQPPIIQVINKTGQPSKQTQKSNPGGSSITQIIIGAVAADIANGGQVGQAMQSNYGVSRSGVKRG